MEIDFTQLYKGFDAPITAFDCGKKCAPYNEEGKPFCCDTRHAVPSVYEAEWIYLSEATDLWHAWEGETPKETERLQKQTPEGHCLVECKGHLLCQRGFRSLTCRSFPFFPYVDKAGNFLGLSYYWEYEDRCWVISNLGDVTAEYLGQFITTYEEIFRIHPQDFSNFQYHSMQMRKIFGRRHQAITLLHRNGNFYKITPRNGRLRKMDKLRLPKFGPYQISATLKFPDEQ